MTTNRQKEAEKFSSAETKPRAFRMTQGEWRKESRAAFRAYTKNKAKPSHVLAEILECNPKTAQSWLDGDSTPAGILDLRAMALIPEYAALKRKLANQESALDPRVQETIQQLHRMTIELAGGI